MSNDDNLNNVVYLILIMIVTVPFILPFGFFSYRIFLERKASNKFRKYLSSIPTAMQSNRVNQEVCGDRKDSTLYNCANACLTCVPFFIFASVRALNDGQIDIVVMDIFSGLFISFIYAYQRNLIVDVDFATFVNRLPGIHTSQIFFKPIRIFFIIATIALWAFLAYSFYSNSLSSILSKMR